jgi:hypothetical protein
MRYQQRAAARPRQPTAKKDRTAAAPAQLAVLPLVMRARPSYAAAGMRKIRLHKHNLKLAQ